MLIASYTSSWQTQFDKIHKTLSRTLQNLLTNIEHVGSTAVPTLAAKPIIDIDIIYNEPADFEIIKNRLASVGYYHNGNQGVAGREVFKRTSENLHAILDSIPHHLYVCQYDCLELHLHLFFRDYLRTHETARAFYQQLKYEIATEANEDKKMYASIKEVKASSFINYIVYLAKLEHNEFSKVGDVGLTQS